MFRILRNRKLIALLAVMALTAACGSGSGASTTQAPPGTNTSTSVPGSPSSTIPDVISDASDPAVFAALVERAEDEGTVTYYTSTSSEDMEAIEEMFEAEYDIDLVVVRSGGAEILQRFLLEQEAGTVIADLLGHSEGGAWLDFYDKGYLQCFKSQYFDELHEFAVGPDGCFSADNGSAMGIIYRTDLLEDEGIAPPTSWQDLLRPEFQGRLGLPNPNFSSFVTVVVTVMSEDLGWDYFQGLKANNPVILPGGGGLMSALEAGEIIAAGMSTAGRPVRAMLDGLPIAYVYPVEGSYVSSSFSAVPAGAPNPNAGKLLADFLLSDEVQQYLADHGSYAGRKGFSAPEGMTPLEDLEILPIDYRFIRDNSEERVAEFTEIFDAPLTEE